MRFSGHLKSLLRNLLLISVAISATLDASITQAIESRAAASADTKPAIWPQDSSDLKPDPAIKFGVLANGMRFVIMHNNTPTNNVSLRFRFDTGSIQESNAQQGIAHVLEHMAFRGSKHVPDGEVDKSLQRIGLQFGADTNAFTSNTQTVYKFDLPNASDENVDIGLMLMREIASELNITDEALKTERGVVLSELRLRDTAEQRAGKEELAVMMSGMRAPTRWAIGKAEILEKVDAQTVRSYYEAYYHPERATLIVVGDIDPEAITKKIETKFSDWKPATRSAADPDFGVFTPMPIQTRIFVDPSLPTSISLDWADAYDPSARTRAMEQEDVIRKIGLDALNMRFEQAALSDDAPFTNAEADYTSNLLRSARGTSVSISTTPEKWHDGLNAAQRIINDALSKGLHQDEVDRAIANFQTGLQNAVTGSNTRRTPSLADGFVFALENNEVFLNPQQKADIAQAVLKNLTAENVTATLRQTFSGTRTVVFMTSAKPIEGGEAALADSYKQALHEVSSNSDAQSIKTWPYTHFGKAGKVVKQQTLKDIDTTFVRFKNGVSLAVKHTNFTAGQIEVNVRVGNGKLGIDKNKPNASFLLNSLVSGGLDKIDSTTMQQVLAGKTYRLDASLAEDHVALRGTTTPENIDTQLQVITAYLLEPAFRNGAVEQLRNFWSFQIPQLESQPLYNLSSHVPGLIRNDDPRWTFPTLEQVKSAKIDDLKTWLLPQLKEGAIQVSIVGDISVQRAIAITAATLGALPARPTPHLKTSAPNELKFTAATASPVVLHHTGGKDQAAAAIAWPVNDRRSSLNEVADMQVLSAIMRSRLIDAMRPRTGSSYTANVGYDGSWVFTGFGSLQAISDIKPEHTQVFFDEVNTIIEDLRSKPVSADEFSRAQKPMLAGIDKSRQTNAFFAQLLVAPDVDPLLSEWIRKLPEYIKAVTPQRVQAVAQKYLIQDKEWKAVMMPQETLSVETK